jgi:hypothetical protein
MSVPAGKEAFRGMGKPCPLPSAWLNSTLVIKAWKEAAQIVGFMNFARRAVK